MKYCKDSLQYSAHKGPWVFFLLSSQGQAALPYRADTGSTSGSIPIDLYDNTLLLCLGKVQEMDIIKRQERGLR